MGWTRAKRRLPPWRPERWPTPAMEPRVLLEDADGATRWVNRRMLEDIGFEVGECPGPGPDGTDRWTCPLVHEGRCELVEGADAVVFSLSVRDPETAAILEAHRKGLADRALCIEATALELQGRPGLAEGAEIVDPISSKALRTAVVSAIAKRGKRMP